MATLSQSYSHLLLYFQTENTHTKHLQTDTEGEINQLKFIYIWNIWKENKHNKIKKSVDYVPRIMT